MSVCRWLGLAADGSRRGAWWIALQTLCRAIVPSLFHIRVFGRENVPARGGVLIASSHQSFLDPVLISVGLSRPVTFMARDTLFRWAPFRWLIRSLNAFPVRRGKPDLSAVREAIARLQAGWATLLFPEGTRTHDGRIGRLHPGLGMIARRAETCIVPAAIEGAFQAWPRHRLLFRPGTIHVAFGRPIWPGDEKEADLTKRVRDAMESLHAFLMTSRARALGCAIRPEADRSERPTR